MPKRFSFLRNYYIALIATAIIFGWALHSAGLAGLFSIVILSVTEITFSFENAVINSQVLARFNKFWRTMFLTVGIAIAVFGVRMLLPLVLVARATGDSLRHVLDLALNHPEVYAEELHSAYPVIAAFGSVFLLMIGLQFFGEHKEVYWLKRIETKLQSRYTLWGLPLLGATIAMLLMYFFFRPGNKQVLSAAVAGAATFIVIKIVSHFLEKRQGAASSQTHATGKLALTLFLYLEILDASFSFDGVIAAFAITQDVVLIAAGLGIGALYVRSMTVHLLNNGTLGSYRYLLHGAHYAILVLGLLLLCSMRFTIPEPVTGFVGLMIIVASFASSVSYNRRLNPNNNAA